MEIEEYDIIFCSDGNYISIRRCQVIFFIIGLSIVIRHNILTLDLCKTANRGYMVKSGAKCPESLILLAFWRKNFLKLIKKMLDICKVIHYNS